MTIKLSKGFFSRTEDIEIPVQDTKPPVIELTEDSFELEIGDEFDPAEHVAQVSDPVDGDLELVDEQPQTAAAREGEEEFYDSGWYVILSDVDTDAAGTYEVEVVSEDKHGNEVAKVLPVTVIDPFADVHLNKTTKVLEYSKKDVDPVKLVKCSDPEVTVTADRLSLRSTGKKEVAFTLTKHGKTKELTRTFKVRDTKAPTIELASDSFSIEYGGSFDPYQSVKSVTDPVDGQLARVDSVPQDNGDGWYTVEGAYNATSPGRYFFTVVACDCNGNKVQKEFSLEVEDPPVVEDNGRDYVLNTSTRKFHYPTCYHIKQMNDYNKWEVHMTRDEVVGMGYSPCGHCNP